MRSVLHIVGVREDGGEYRRLIATTNPALARAVRQSAIDILVKFGRDPRSVVSDELPIGADVVDNEAILRIG